MIYFICLQAGYLFFRYIVRFQQASQFLFDLIKEQVFIIGGACRHSGRCCSKIMLYDSAKPLNTMTNWRDFLKQNSQYQSFVPNHYQGHISSFDCECLTPDKKCNQYASRPSICRQYPTSFFFQHGFIYDTCGYFVEKNEHRFDWLFPSIRFQLESFVSV